MERRREGERSLGGGSKPAARRDGERESDRRSTGVGSRARPSARARAARRVRDGLRATASLSGKRRESSWGEENRTEGEAGGKTMLQSPDGGSGGEGKGSGVKN